MKFLLVWFLVGYLEVPFIKGDQPKWRAGPNYPRPLPQEIMVDAVNYIGLVLLQAHNQNNENNIALSPYGATSVLVALGEGVQGTALNEILRATLLPLDVSVTRVGLRDIHRHLKSYFIPQEGFLAGLTFSHENVTLKSSYEDTLRFYGYDVDSFNNALYPDPYSTTTNIGSESTTESLSSVSHTANFSSSSSSTTETVPISSSTIALPSTLHTQIAETITTTLSVPSTIINRDDFNSSESTTIETTLMTNDSIESTSGHTTRAINTTSTTSETSQITTVTNQPTPASTSPIIVTTAMPSTTNAEPTQESAVTTTTPVTTKTTTPVSTTTTTPVITTITTPLTTTTTTPVITTTTTPVTTTTTTTPVTTTITTTTSTTTTTQITTTTPTESTVTTLTPSTSMATSEQPTTFIDSNTAEVTVTSSGTIGSTRTTSELGATTNAASSSTTSTTSAPTYITTSQDSTPSATLGSTITVSQTPTITTTIPLTSTTVTQSTRPTAVTISVVPSTVGNGLDESTPITSSTSTAPTTLYDGTGPIVVNLQPTTLESTSSNNSATESSESAAETTSTTVPTTVAILIEDSPTIEDEQSTTNGLLNSQSTTLNSNSEPTAFTIDIVPSTLGTAIPASDSTTENSIPSLITPAGDSLDGFQIDVRPTTIGPKSADIAITEGVKTRRMITTRPNSLPRFRDDIELIKSLKFENTDAAMSKVVARSIISQTSTSKNSIRDKESTEKERPAFVQNVKDIIIDASIGKTPIDSTISSTSDSMEDAGEFNISLYTETEKVVELTSDMNQAEMKELYDRDVIIVNHPGVVENSAEITLPEKEMFSKPSSDEAAVLTDDNTEYEKTRGTRSVIDYLIARYHDNNPSNIQMPGGGSTEYEPIKPTTFAVNGKIRESNINFMTYDTVLPFRYISYLNALALTFPLDSSKYYLLLILPLDEMGIDNLIANMLSTTLKQIIYHLQPTRVKATIPSFMLKGYVVLTPTLQKLGIRQIFEPRHADFSRMTDDKDIYVTNIEQAVTVTIRNYVDPSTLQNNQHFRRRGPVQFIADHPFLYFVMDSQIHVALMAGKIINPLNSRIR